MRDSRSVSSRNYSSNNYSKISSGHSAYKNSRSSGGRNNNYHKGHYLTVEKRNTDNRDNFYRDQDNKTKKGVTLALKSKSSSRNGSLDMSN